MPYDSLPSRIPDYVAFTASHSHFLTGVPGFVQPQPSKVVGQSEFQLFLDHVGNPSQSFCYHGGNYQIRLP